MSQLQEKLTAFIPKVVSMAVDAKDNKSLQWMRELYENQLDTDFNQENNKLKYSITSLDKPISNNIEEWRKRYADIYNALDKFSGKGQYDTY